MAVARDDLTPAGLLDAANVVVRRRRLLEVDELDVALAWADVHSGDAPGGLVAFGGDGTPWVQDHCLGELALARSMGVAATSNAIADALDLRHRLPLTWAAMRTGVIDAWVPRRVAKMSRHLPFDRVGVVDRAVARMVGREAAGRILAVAEAKIIEADPGLHQRRVEEEQRRRYVSQGRVDEYGLRTFIARIDAADAVWLEATVSRVAEILTPLHEGLDAQEVRAIAFGHLARPAELLMLLLEHLDPDDDLLAGMGNLPDHATNTDSTSGTDPDTDTDAGDQSELESEPVSEEGEGEGVLNRAMALPAAALAALQAANWSTMAPRAVLYVHLHETALHGTDAVARVEGLGPVTSSQLRVLLAGARVSVKPVIDLADRIRSTAYEHPEALKERVHLITGGDYWPWATSTSRNVDFDHVTPYDRDGPPGQTGTHNSGPLGRRHHRWKTHAGFRAVQVGVGEYVWTTPHGLCFLVDHAGSRSIDPRAAAVLINAPAWVSEQEYPPPVDPGPFWELDDHRAVA